MVFSFTFFIYNGQRIFRLRNKLLQLNKIGDRLLWVIRYKKILSIFSILFGLTGVVCAFFIHPFCWAIIIPVGILSLFYVIPFFSKHLSLRELPYLKIFIIGLVWSLIIVWLPFVDSQVEIEKNSTIFIAMLQNFLFIIAITLPFDIRDLNFDKVAQLKTIPQLIGTKKTILLSEILLSCSILLLFIIQLNIFHFYGLLIGYLLTMLLVLNTNSKRKELFYACLIEGTVLIIYSCVLIVDYFFSL